MALQDGLLTKLRASRSAGVIRLMRRATPRVGPFLFVWMTINSLLPNTMIVVTGRIISSLPGAARHGFGSPSGHSIVVDLIVFGVVLGLAFSMTPIRSGLAMMSQVRVIDYMHRTLMSAVSGPTGVHHLEDATILDRVARARGSLINTNPGDAPITFMDVLSYKVAGLVSCVLIGTVRWWLGLVMFLLWQGVRRPMLASTRAGVMKFSDYTPTIRRAMYFQWVSSRAPSGKEIRIFGLGHYLVVEARRYWSHAIESAWKDRAHHFRLIPSLQAVVLVSYTACCAYIAHAAWVGAITVAQTAVVLALMTRVYYVGSLFSADISFEWAMSGMPDLEALAAELTAEEPASAGLIPAAGLPHNSIRFEQVRFTYPGAATPVLHEFDLEIAAGRSTAIVGLNGAGKTTLVKLIARLHEPEAGRILVDGIDLRSLEADGWQRRIAVVFQDFNQYPLTARENIAFGAPEFAGDEAGVQQAARRARALPVIDALSKGFDTILSRQYEGGTDLSGGEWQRVALARALFAVEHGATVLVLDEPTAMLDVRGEAAFYESFFDLTDGLTTIVISHRFSTVRLADEIVVLDSGFIAERGSHAELVASGGRYAEMFRLQAERFIEVDEETVA